MPTTDRPNSVWRSGAYRWLWTGQTISLTGNGALQVAFPLLVLVITKSPAEVGFMNAVRGVFYVLLSLPLNVVVVRWNYQLTMLVCDVARALCIGAVPVVFSLGGPIVGLLYVGSVALGVLGVVFDDAKALYIRQLVPEDQIPSTIWGNQVTIGVAGLLGPVLGGALFVQDLVLPFIVGAFAFAASGGTTLLLRSDRRAGSSYTSRNLRTEMMVGFQWLNKQRLLLFMAFMSGGDILMTAGYALIVIVIAQEQGASALLIGLIFTVGGAAGIGGSLLAPWFQRRFTFGTVIVSTMWLFSLLWLPLIFFPSVAMLCLVMALFFFLSPLFNVTYVDYRHALTPESLRGQVDTVARWIGYSFTPVSWLLTGLLLEFAGSRTTVIACAAGLALLALAATINPRVRTASPRLEAYAATKAWESESGGSFPGSATDSSISTAQ